MNKQHHPNENNKPNWESQSGANGAQENSYGYGYGEKPGRDESAYAAGNGGSEYGQPASGYASGNGGGEYGQPAPGYGEPAAGYGASNYNGGGYNGGSQEPPKKNWVPAAIISAVVAVLLIGGGIFAYFTFFNKSEDNKADEQHNEQKHEDKQPEPAPAPTPAPSPNPGPNPNPNPNPSPTPTPNPTKKLDPNSSFCRNVKKLVENGAELQKLSSSNDRSGMSSKMRLLASTADILAKSKEAHNPENYAKFAKIIRSAEKDIKDNKMDQQRSEGVLRELQDLDKQAIPTDVANCGFKPQQQVGPRA
ncbi:MAG: hypothetical protein Q4C71_06085 [Microbacteriaceae bacterium]|nr:hypothetical protein [Microbacteriaceae bacterium]